MKTNITDTLSVLDYFLGLPIKDYDVIASGDRFTGVIAQELLADYPELVVMGEDGYYGVKEIRSWKFVKVIQEIIAKISGLDVRMDELEARIKVLEARQFFPMN